MEISEALTLSKALAADIQTLVQNYENTTGAYVHSIPVVQRSATAPVTVDVKVQITPPRS